MGAFLHFYFFLTYIKETPDTSHYTLESIKDQEEAMRRIFWGVLVSISCVLASGVDTLFSQVQNLKVSLGGYTIGQPLSDAQWKIAQQNEEAAQVPGTFKFKDGDIHVVADAQNHRVLVVYQAYNNSHRAALKETIGRLMGELDEPTTMTHGKIIYWFYNQAGKMSKIDLDQHKEGIKTPQTLQAALSEEPKATKTAPILSIKLSSDIDILPGADPHQPKPAEVSDEEAANFYVIAASEAILKQYVTQSEASQK